MPHYEDEDVKQLEYRVDDLENRMTAVEVQIKDGFTDIKNLMQNLFQERSEWGKFFRSALTSIGKFCQKYGGIILLAAIGLGNLETILKIFGL